MYLGSWKIDDVVTFSVTTHRFDTGAATDADAAPTYRIYENETSTPIVTGTMALLDSTNTAGLYSEAVTLSAASGFEKGKSYNIYITAAVNSVTGTTIRSLQIEAEVDANVVSGSIPSLAAQAKADVNAEVLDVLATDTFAEPAGVPAATSTLKDMIKWMFTLSRNKITQTSTTQTLRNDADSGSISTSSHSSDGTTFSRGEWS